MKQIVHKIRHYRSHRYFWPVAAGTIFLGFFGLMSFMYVYQSFNYHNEKIAHDIAMLKDIFLRIDADAKIAGFDESIVNIDFLNVGSFSGKNVGPMGLVYPEKWKGPYLKDEPKMQGKPYQLVKTYDGYFIVPGQGVRLYNGKVMGHDIVINHQTDIEALVKDPEMLMSQGKALAAKLPLHTNAFDLTVPLDLYASPEIPVD